jgi:PAS domain S-box-containing protein
MSDARLQDRRLRAEREAERIFEMSPALLAVAGFDGYLRRFNPAFEVFGYSREELLSRPWIEFAHPDDRERMLEAVASLEHGADVVELENRVICRDGSARWVKWSTRVVPEEGLFYAAGRDVTESRRAEEEQAGLRRVATLVARETAPEAVFAAVAREVCEVLGVDATQLGRYDGDSTVAAVAHWGRYPGVPIGTRFSLEGDSVSARVLRTGKPARIDDYADLAGVIPDTLRRLGIRSAIGVPISVEGRTWGVMTVTSKRDPPFPAETESRLQDFTELVATAISNATAYDKVRVLADEHAALRRVATLVAREPPPAEIFAAVAEEVAALLGVEDATIFRYEDDEIATVVADRAGERAAPLEIGSRMSLAGESATALVRRTGRPSRLDDFSNATGPLAEYTRDAGIGSSVASPIVVDGRLWGAVVVATREKEPLPQTTEARIGQFTELVATAIANVQARVEVARLADEQAALRRVATVVAHGASQTEVFTAIAKECGGLFGTSNIGFVRFDGEDSLVLASSGVFREAFPPGSRQPLGGDNATTQVYRTGKPVRIDDYSDSATGLIGETARRVGVRSVVATPVVVDDRLWGAMVIGTAGAGPLPPDTEVRVAQFTELMATAIANTESHARAELLADEQAALRRVATLVAQGVEADELFAAVTNEFAGLFPGVPSFTPNIVRFDPGPEFVLVGTSAPEAEPPLGWRWPPTDAFASTRVWRTGCSAYVDATELDAHSGSEVESLRRLGFLYQAGSPIVVEGQLWGALTIDSGLPLPPDSGARLERFTEVIATAIANIESREELSELADEQAALSRVATLVAEGVEPAALFAAVTKEVERLFFEVSPSVLPSIIRFDPGPEFVLVGTSKDQLKLPLGSHWGLKDLYASTRVFLSGASVRVEAAEVLTARGPDSELLQEQGFLYQIGSPIMVEGQLWGAMTINSTDELPPDTEKRLEKFTELVATAIANSESRAGLRRLALEQAGLRRVATLVAQGAPPSDVFDAVIAEVAAFIGADNMVLSRYEDEREATVLAHRGPMADRVPAGTRVKLDGDNIHSRIRPTRRPARMEQWDRAHGTIAGIANEVGVRAAVGVPVLVEGELWGVMVASWTTVDSAPTDAESRMAKFVDLLETAIANADTRDQLKASRVRLLTEADDARRRVVRDLHDGAQQRLVHSIIRLKLAQRALGGTDTSAASLLDEALAQAEQANVELRELAHGILPSVLTRGGLRAGVDTVVSRIDLPVEIVDITAERFAAEIEASAYFIIAEALTNVVKHAQATSAEVKAWVEHGELRLQIVDDGVGGADPTGHGLVGLSDRATALGGSFGVGVSPSGGTFVLATFPL